MASWWKTLRMRWRGPPKGVSLPLSARIQCLREVLQANNQALGVIARIQETLAGERPATPEEVRRLVAAVTVQTWRMASNLHRMTGERESILVRRFDEIRERLTRRVDVGPVLRDVGPVVPLAEVGSSSAEVVGQKSAFLGEAMRLLGDRVPDGFATTVEAYRKFIEEGGLAERIAQRVAVVDPRNVASCFAASADVVRWIEAAPVPPDLDEALRGAAARLGVPRLAVRSSALMEGGAEMSFAGQYRSLLNVSPDGVSDAFRSVLASKYSPEALTYRLVRGIADADVAMCCCVLGMVDARAAGVAYSLVQTPEGPRALVQAVRGLGLSAVDGSVEPWSFLVDPVERRVVGRKAGLQTHLLAMAEAEGTRRVEVPPAEASRPVLDDALVLKVAEAAWTLQDGLGDAVDVEWAVTAEGRLFVLQVRPQPGHEDLTSGTDTAEIEGATVLLRGGARASRGAACGPVALVRGDLDLLRCPPGAVVVVREANPRFAVLLRGAAAVVADLGEVTGHLAAVAREMKVPALFATRSATAILRPGQEVTVDAHAGVVYAGRVEDALRAARERSEARPRDTQALRTLRAVSDLVVPLHLTGRLASGYRARDCRSLHDIIRYCHQKSVQSLFDLGDAAMRKGREARRLRSPVPMDCRVLDLGGGLRDDAPPDGDILLDHVACRPMVELWLGMTDPRLRWTTPRSVSARGFLSSVVNYNFDQDRSVRRMGDPSYVFITNDYVNLNSRIGYHFSTVDARVTDHVERNHLSFRFVGGSTGIEQRSRRGLLIERVLRARGFETDRTADLVNARTRHRPPDEMHEALRLVGLLMGYVNHLDMELVSDEVMHEYEAAFLRGDYGYKGERAGG